MTPELHSYEYVNRPFRAVRDAVLADALRFLGPATSAATERARVLVDTLKVEAVGVEVGKRVIVTVTNIQPHAEAPGRIASDAIEIEIAWKAASQEDLFPSMRAKLLVYPLSATETQLDLRGVYEPPGGVIGALADRLVGHLIARAAVDGFLAEMKTRVARAVPE